ncbi:Na+/H+ antiporter subunit E [Corynebacterium sp. YIM 101645]|uniref:Na+/H+ antiporter subunit E n=1 Tax=Corynebacterium lemuris TaxID=1859292 RepID=A0ABT2G097_9CORY|nr:Na+/H+ antiporter subunit E [Corynebacterium lemuris]MCS5480928.1 Na+/H+ antiporter subunit E [Corynebacterium lemuris]
MKWVVAVVLRVFALVVVWEAVSSWEPAYALYGLVSVGAATALSLRLVPPGRMLRLRGAVVLLSWFLYKAVAGGIDVARRAVRPTPDIEPAVVRAHLRLPPGHSRELAMLLMNLMPGTMVQRVREEEVELHTLSLELRPVQQWEDLQDRVARACGLDPGSG